MAEKSVITYHYLTPGTIQQDDLSDLNWLLNQLTEAAEQMTDKYLAELCERSFLLVARVEGEETILGMNTLCIEYTPTGKIGVVHALVVDESMQGQGIGRKLVELLIERAKSEGANSLHLTSNPTREDANRLYLKLGFERYDTNKYKMNF